MFPLLAVCLVSFVTHKIVIVGTITATITATIAATVTVTTTRFESASIRNCQEVFYIALLFPLLLF